MALNIKVLVWYRYKLKENQIGKLDPNHAPLPNWIYIHNDNTDIDKLRHHYFILII